MGQWGVEDVAAFRKAKSETEPDKLDSLALGDLQSYYQELSQIVLRIEDGRCVSQCRDRIELLRREIELRRIEERSERQHQEAMKQGSETLGVSDETLCWTKVAAVAAVIGVIATVLFGILQIWLSNTGTSRVDQASPRSSLQTTTPTAASPEPEASSSTSTASPEPAAEVTP
jgi:hypothetical protein